MGISRAETGPNLRDAQIAVARAMGLTLEEVGRAVSTPKHPNGVSKQTVVDRLGTNKEFIEPFMQWVTVLMGSYKNKVVDELTEKDLRRIIKNKSLNRLEKLIDSENENVALSAVKEGLDRTEGKAPQTNINLVSGQVNHIVTHQLPEAFIAQLPNFAEQHGLAPIIDVPALEAGEES